MNVDTPVKRPSPDEQGLTPLMRQYLTAKAEHPDAVMLFRMGDFWETFYEDAIVASKVLGLTLTSRGTEKGDPVPLAGVPLVSLEPSLAKLVAAGHRVAICDQVEDAKQAKGIVKRAVVEVVSAGTTTIPGLLEDRRSRYLLAASPDLEAGRVGFARCDITTGEFVAWEVAEAAAIDEIDRLQPAEVLLPDGDLPDGLLKAASRESAVERVSPTSFDPSRAPERIQEGPGFVDGQRPGVFAPTAVAAAAALLDYLDRLKKVEAQELSPLEFEEDEGHLVLDEISLRNLEILRPLREGAKSSTLLSVVDRTTTPMGARLLRDWLSRPLLAPERIRVRHDAVAEMVQQGETRSEIREALSAVADLERITMRIAAGRGHARDLRGLANSLEQLPALKERLTGLDSELFATIVDGLHDFSPEVDSINEAIVDEPPLALKEGGLIRPGFSPELDRVRTASREGKDWIAALQAKERERTGVANLKIGYNRVFGYYIEVTKANRTAVPDDYERRQTLVNAERYITPELKERESEILGADERAKGMEYDLFLEIRGRLALACPRIREAARSVAVLDVLLGFAELAVRRSWVRPVIHDGGEITIQGGRHPVVEASLPAHEFVPNDTFLDAESRQILLLTGPNMAGKSTYLRQVALIVVLAQTGGFVPAESAEVGVVDRVFTRVGASDHVAAGHSTFMVEMVEVSRILAAASPRSLVLLDEVGRGTSTYDGLAIAWAVTEYLHEQDDRCARTLFATHYHELTELTEQLSRMRNLRVTVHEWKDEVVFLRKVVEGAADRSFGIQVAKLAGLPASVTARAKKILKALEDGTFLTGRDASPSRASGDQLDLFSSAGAAILGELAAIDPNSMTPMEALAVLSEWKRRTEGDGE